MFTAEQKVIALLEMASEAERLQRIIQAENLYKRAVVVAHNIMVDGAGTAATVAILYDIARVCEQRGERDEAEFFYNRACAVGFLSRSATSAVAA